MAFQIQLSLIKACFSSQNFGYYFVIFLELSKNFLTSFILK